MKKWVLPLVLLLLFVVEILGIYFIMPFPGSQYDNTVGIAWFFHKNLIWIRILFLLIVFWQVYKLIKNKKYWRFGFTIFFLFLYTIIAWFINTKMNADTMFFQPENKIFAGVAENKIAEGKLIIGVEINNESKAYPIEIIGYHHQVRDNVGGKEIMVTYCTVCRTVGVGDSVAVAVAVAVGTVVAAGDKVSEGVAVGSVVAWLEANMDDLVARTPSTLAHVVRRSCEIKAWVVGQDERESGVRAILNFGHTFGHAIEAGMGYGEWLHGEAVGCGMVMAAQLSHRLGLVDALFVARLTELIARAGLPVKGPILNVDDNAGRYLELMRVDKKAEAGDIKFVLIDGPGRAVVRSAPEAMVREVIDHCCSQKLLKM